MSENIEKFKKAYNNIAGTGAGILTAEGNLEYHTNNGSNIEIIEKSMAKVTSAIEAHEGAIEFAKEIPLNKSEAIELVKMKTLDNGILDLTKVDGVEAYQFMNATVRNQAEVALTAYQENEKREPHEKLADINMPKLLEGRLNNQMNNNPELNKEQALEKLSGIEEVVEKYNKAINYGGNTRTQSRTLGC